MNNRTPNIDEPIGELLSGYIDGELTQQERQRVELLCAEHRDYRELLDELRDLRQQVGKTRLSEFGEDQWRESMNDAAVQTTFSIGWLLLIGGLLGAVGVGVFGFITDPSVTTLMKLIAGAVYGGLAILLISVIRQRLIERKTDKYKDVEI